MGAYRVGLDRLGERYLYPGLIDDTGMKLLLAEDNANQGNLPAAAHLYDRILEARLEVYAEHFGLKP